MTNCRIKKRENPNIWNCSKCWLNLGSHKCWVNLGSHVDTQRTHKPGIYTWTS
jgi:ribosomal protein L37AE/L43A